jgi:hypothetical protein
VDEDSPATVSFTDPSDPSAADTDAGFHYAFACDGASLASATYASSGTDPSASCTFDDGDSNPDVTGRIIDRDGGYFETTTTVAVENVAPVATFAIPAPVSEGDSFALSLTGPSDVSETDAATGFTYAFDCGDGQGYGSFDTDASATCQSADGPAAPAVGGKIRDKDDGVTEYTDSVTVVNAAPTAMVGGPYIGTAGNPVTFSGDATDPAGSDDTLTYRWDFMYDGTTFAVDSQGVDQKTPSSTYLFPGTYSVALQVTDEDGGTSTLSATSVTISTPSCTRGRITGDLTWIRSIKTSIDIHSSSTSTNPTGPFKYTGDGRAYTATRLDCLIVDPNGVDAKLYGMAGLVKFRLDVHDGGDPGTSDTLRLRTSAGYDSGILSRSKGNLKVAPKP